MFYHFYVSAEYLELWTYWTHLDIFHICALPPKDRKLTVLYVCQLYILRYAAQIVAHFFNVTGIID